jgi:hypothetical protein
VGAYLPHELLHTAPSERHGQAEFLANKNLYPSETTKACRSEADAAGSREFNFSLPHPLKNLYFD